MSTPPTDRTALRTYGVRRLRWLTALLTVGVLGATGGTATAVALAHGSSGSSTGSTASSSDSSSVGSDDSSSSATNSWGSTSTGSGQLSSGSGTSSHATSGGS